MIHPGGKSHGYNDWNRGARFLVTRPQTLAVHEVADKVTAERDLFTGLVSEHPPAAAAGILEVGGVDPGRVPQSRVTHRHRPVIERQSRQAHQQAMPADAGLRMVVID